MAAFPVVELLTLWVQNAMGRKILDRSTRLVLRTKRLRITFSEDSPH